MRGLSPDRGFQINTKSLLKIAYPVVLGAVLIGLCSCAADSASPVSPASPTETPIPGSICPNGDKSLLVEPRDTISALRTKDELGQGEILEWNQNSGQWGKLANLRLIHPGDKLCSESKPSAMADVIKPQATKTSVNPTATPTVEVSPTRKPEILKVTPLPTRTAAPTGVPAAVSGTSEETDLLENPVIMGLAGLIGILSVVGGAVAIFSPATGSQEQGSGAREDSVPLAQDWRKHSLPADLAKALKAADYGQRDAGQATDNAINAIRRASAAYEAAKVGVNSGRPGSGYVPADVERSTRWLPKQTETFVRELGVHFAPGSPDEAIGELRSIRAKFPMKD